jgi:methionyl-tRNA synthetase
MELIDPVSTITSSRPEKRSTTHWYLQLQRLEKDLGEWLAAKRDTDPAWRDWILNFVLGQIKQGLPERAMTRDLEWGVPVPLDDPDASGKALYVWFDAPIGYISFTACLCQAEEGDWQGYKRWWKDPECKILHFIGEDNIVFHALTWPAMLMAEGSYQLPEQVVANAFLNIKFPGQEETKVSKSRGTAIWIDEFLEKFDPDPLRYYLTAVAPEKRRTPFNADDFISRNNGELLNALGNFINRTLTFVQRYFDGRVPAKGQREAVDHGQLALIAQQADQVAGHMDRFQFKAALAEVMALSRAANGYMDTKQPWKQRKDDMAACGTTMNVCVQTVKALATLMAPFLPFSAEKCVEMLNAPTGTLAWREATVEIPEAHQLGEPAILFKKLELDDLIG